MSKGISFDNGVKEGDFIIGFKTFEDLGRSYLRNYEKQDRGEHRKNKT